jgi:hypothetical protein
VAIFALTLSVVSEDWFGDQEAVIGEYIQAMGWIESKTASGIFALTLSMVSEDWFGDREAVNGEYMQAMGSIESKTVGGNICLDIVNGV